MTDRVLLIGMMGSGKTSVGRLVADRLGWAYLDSDAEVERATGLTVPEIFSQSGEAAFRAEESAALARALACEEPAVVSVAGGAVLDAHNRVLINAAGAVVWLRCRPETLAVRVGDGAGRPLLDGDPAEVLRRLDAVRRPFYSELAEMVVDTDGTSPEAVARQVVSAVFKGEVR